MQVKRPLLYVCALIGTFAGAQEAKAQRASEDALADADDAFGTSVGIERTGIYSQDDTRGFSPKKAGNVRIEGIYFDQVASLSGRLRQSSAIRVGFAAENFPFPAPTGVVDNRLYGMPKELGASVGLHRTGYWGTIAELDLRVPVLADHIGLTGGVSRADYRVTDGSKSISEDVTAKATIRFAHSEFAPFITRRWFPAGLPPTLVVVDGDFLPEQPRTRRYLGQRWAKTKFDNITAGATFKSRLTKNFVFRSGLFHSGGGRAHNFAEIYAVREPGGLSSHVLIADPKQETTSDSGEAQVVFLAGDEKWKHRVYFGYRFRVRTTESGGSDIVNFGDATYGVPDPRPEQQFDFSEINLGKVNQSATMIGYIGFIKDLATINLGLQKSRYRSSFRNAAAGTLERSRANPWLYNAMVELKLSRKVSLYGGTQRGLEDSGNAPENAANRLAQLPATKTTQYEAGVHWRLPGGHLFVNAFEITKPYFSFDEANVFTQLGTERHRGVEASFSGHFGKRLSVLAGAVLMDPTVSAEGQRRGIVGDKPTGVPSLSARVDANYRTDLLGGFTPTATLQYRGKSAVGARPQDSLGGKQLMVPAFVRIDLGFRQHIEVGGVSASLRGVVNNVFDEKSWKILAPNTLKLENRRRFTLSLTADI